MNPYMKDRIDGVLLDTDEDGFHLVFSGEHSEYDFTFDPEAASALLAAVAELQPWVRPARPRPTLPLFDSGDPDMSRKAEAMFGGGYEPDDPKSEGYHDRMSR